MKMPIKSKIKPTGCGDMYITVNCDTDGNIIEIIARLGKAGGCAASQEDAVSALITLVLRGKINPKEIIKRLSGISCTQGDNDSSHSCSDAIAIAMSQAINDKTNK